ncbi:MAG: site-specific integrase [Polyangiaceae bacterium]|nr:site-specific integrase [Polyangiaceae bacterium]
MAVVRRMIKGQKYWVIDRRFTSPTNEERYRRVAKVQNRSAAEAEERALIEVWQQYGTLKPEVPTKTPKKKVKGKTWDDAVKHYRDVILVTKKPSTQWSYNQVLESSHMAHWLGWPLDEITKVEIEKWAATLIKEGLSASSRRNQQVMLRTVLKSVVGTMVDDTPVFPSLPKVGRTAVEAPDPEDVRKLLGEGDDPTQPDLVNAQRRAGRLAFALAAYAGLRAGEVRALRRRDVDLKRGIITVRLARTYGKEAPPKSGHEREIPITGPLMTLLKPRLKAMPDNPMAYVSMSVGRDGKDQVWGDYGFRQALLRACRRLRITCDKYHGLRHYFATSLFASGKVDARTVQGLLGHSSLEVTQRYAHHSLDRARAAVEAVWG